MRERQLEIKGLKKQLEEKDEMMAVLQGQMEMMRKQVIMMKTAMTKKSSSNNMDVTQDTETQTSSPTMGSGRCESRSPSTSTISSRRSGKRKGACCVIS